MVDSIISGLCALLICKAIDDRDICIGSIAFAIFVLNCLTMGG